MTNRQGIFLIVAIFPVVSLICPPHMDAASTWYAGTVTVRSIRQIENALKGKPGIEIELHNTERFHKGDLDWSLQIGDLKLARPTRRSADHHSLTYVLDLDDWNNLKDGAPLYLTWGYYDAKKKEVKPFAYLNKKILGKTRQSNGTGDSGLTNRFRPIAKSAG